MAEAPSTVFACPVGPDYGWPNPAEDKVDRPQGFVDLDEYVRLGAAASIATKLHALRANDVFLPVPQDSRLPIGLAASGILRVVTDTVIQIGEDESEPTAWLLGDRRSQTEEDFEHTTARIDTEFDYRGEDAQIIRQLSRTTLVRRRVSFAQPYGAHQAVLLPSRYVDRLADAQLEALDTDGVVGQVRRTIRRTIPGTSIRQRIISATLASPSPRD